MHVVSGWRWWWCCWKRNKLRESPNGSQGLSPRTCPSATAACSSTPGCLSFTVRRRRRLTRSVAGESGHRWFNTPALPRQVAASAWCTSPRCRGSPWCRFTAPRRSPAPCAWTAAPWSASGTSGSRPGRRKSSSTSLTWGTDYVSDIVFISWTRPSWRPQSWSCWCFAATTGAVLLLQPWKGHAGLRRDLGGLRATVGPEGAGQHPLPPDDWTGGVDLPAAHLLHWCVTPVSWNSIGLDILAHSGISFLTDTNKKDWSDVVHFRVLAVK